MGKEEGNRGKGKKADELKVTATAPSLSLRWKFLIDQQVLMLVSLKVKLHLKSNVSK